MASSSKVPKASELFDAKVGSSKDKSACDDRVHIYELPFCDDGSVYGENFTGKMVSLHLVHEYPNVWFLFLQALGQYCVSREAVDDSYPKSWQELSEYMNMKIATSSPGKGQKNVCDEDDIGTLVKNRVAIYCDLANVKNICCFLDAFVAWRVVTQLRDSEPEFDQDPVIVFHVAADASLEFTADDGMECTVLIEKDVKQTSISAVQAYPPVWPPRFVIATISSESESTVSVVFSGNTMPFGDAFDAQSIGKTSQGGRFRFC